MRVELLRQVMQRRGLPPRTPLHMFPEEGLELQRGEYRVVAKAAFANSAVLVVTLPLIDGKLGLSLREGEHGIPITGRGGAGGLLAVGDELIALNEHDNLQHLNYGEIIELARSIAVQSPVGGRLEIGIVRPNCLRLPVASDLAGKVIGTGHSTIRMLTRAVGVPLVMLGSRNVADTTTPFQKHSELLVCSLKTSTAALEAQDLLSSVTTGGVFVLPGVAPDHYWLDYSRLQEIEERYGAKILLEWQKTPNDPGAKPLLRVVLQPIPGRKLKVRQVRRWWDHGE